MFKQILIILVSALTIIGSVPAQINIRTLHATIDRAEFGFCQTLDSSFLLTCIQETTFSPSKKHRIIIYKTDHNYNLSESCEFSSGGDSILLPRSIVKVGQKYLIGGHGGIYGEKDNNDYLFTFGFTLILDAELRLTKFYFYQPGIKQPYNIYDSKLLIPSTGELIGLFEVRLICPTIYVDNSLNRFNTYCRFNDSMIPYDFVLDSNTFIGGDLKHNECRITNDLIKKADSDYFGNYMSRLSWEWGNEITKRLDNNFKSVSNKGGLILKSQKSYLHNQSGAEIISASVLDGDADPFTFLGSDIGKQTAIIYRSDTAMGSLRYNDTMPNFTSLETISDYPVEMASHEGLVSDQAGNYYMAYQYGTDSPGQEVDDTLLIIKCNKKLKHIWSKKLNYPGHNIFINEIHVTPGGIVFLSGTDYAFAKNGIGPGLPDAFLIKLDSSGNIILGINEVYHENATIVIYPNPFLDELKINCNETIQEVRLISSFGLAIPLYKNQQGLYNVLDIDVGIYIIEISTKKGFFQRKLIKIQ